MNADLEPTMSGLMAEDSNEDMCLRRVEYPARTGSDLRVADVVAVEGDIHCWWN